MPGLRCDPGASGIGMEIGFRHMFHAGWLLEVVMNIESNTNLSDHFDTELIFEISTTLFFGVK
jgi:hypothetical protein